MKLILAITSFILLSMSGCYKENNNTGLENDFIGICDESLFEIVEEKGYISIIIELKMDDYTPTGLTEEEADEELREAISKIQEEFLESLSGMNISEGRRGKITPWLSITVDKEALIFICSNKKVESVSENIPLFPH